MKIKIFLICFFCCFFLIQKGTCQNEWFNQDAIWYYSTPYYDFELKHCTKVEVMGDTLINGISNKILLFKDCNTNEIISHEYLNFRNDSILYFNYYHDAYFVLYDFTAVAGDTIIVHKDKFKPTNGFQFSYSDSIENFQYIIIKVDSVSISGEWLKRQKVKPVNQGDWGFITDYDTAAYIVESIGSLGYFWGRYGNITTMESIGMLRCYSDNIIIYKSPNWNKECDVISHTNNYPESEGIRIYPNPCNTEIFIESNNSQNIKYVEILNIDGKSIKQVVINNNVGKIDITDIALGCHLIKIFFSDNNLTYRLIKTQ